MVRIEANEREESRRASRSDSVIFLLLKTSIRQDEDMKAWEGEKEVEVVELVVHMEEDLEKKQEQVEKARKRFILTTYQSSLQLG